MTSVPPNLLTRVQALYDAGRYLEAYRAAEIGGPLRAWLGAAERVLATRLMSQLGGHAGANALCWLSMRENPDDPAVRYFAGWRIFGRQGTLAAWRHLERCGERISGPEWLQASWLSLRARVLASLRDFTAALDWLRQAQEIAPRHSWVWDETAAIHLHMDQPEKALEFTLHGLSVKPHCRPTVQTHAEVLVRLGRDEEACDYLQRELEFVESGAVAVQLANLMMERRDYPAALSALDRCAELFPLADRHTRRWLAARRSDLAYEMGDRETAVRLAKAVGPGFHAKIVENLAAAPADARRVQLDVEFVAQHYNTCAPATLAALARFWKIPAEHLQIAEQICYDGTPHHNQRRWAEEQGFFVREFTVDWASVAALIDRGLPFMLTTSGTESGHAQAVIGYDAARRTLLVRDPSGRMTTEYMADGLIEKEAATGPRGMAMVPRERASSLNEAALPDVDLYEHYYALSQGLERHDRERGAEAVRALRESAPHHRITQLARRTLALYDQDWATALQYTQALVEQYPQDVNLQLSSHGLLMEMERRSETEAALRELCDKVRCDPVFWRNYGRLLSSDARHARAADYWLRRSFRFRRDDPECLRALAGLAWRTERREEALRLYRWAACLDATGDYHIANYFRAARYFHQTDTVMEMLRQRLAEFGRRSSIPGRTLAWALIERNEHAAALDVLEASLRLRPDDGELLLYAAETFAQGKRWDEANEFLQRAETCAHRSAWLRSSAFLARQRGDITRALDVWKSVAELEPLSVQAHATVATLLRQTQGRRAAADYLRGVAERFPHHRGIQAELLFALQWEPPEESVELARRVLESHPWDAWARRELALALGRQGRAQEGLEEAVLAEQIEPSNESSPCVRGHLLADVGRRREAREAFRQALRLSVDHESAIQGLFDACDSVEERREALDFLRRELVKQTGFGDGISSFRHHAQQLLPAAEVTAVLREAVAARPDLQQAWVALVRQLTDSEQLDEALSVATQAVEKFPLLAIAWYGLAYVHSKRGDREAERKAIEETLALDATMCIAARRLAELLEQEERFDEALAVLESAVARDPGDSSNHGCLADLLRRRERREEAIDHARRACLIDPAYDWGWATLPAWFAEVGRPDEFLAVARHATEQMPGDARVWFRLAEAHENSKQFDEAVAAADRAVALDPQHVEAHRLRARVFESLGRLEDALAACRPASWPDQAPVALRSTEAHLLAAKGDVEAAIGMMERVVADAPKYGWAWSRLAEWYDATQNPKYADAAQKMVECWPDYCVSWGYQADALLRTDDRAGATTAFEKALSLEPSYYFAANSLIDIHSDGNEWEAAEKVFAKAKDHTKHAGLLLRGLRLAHRRSPEQPDLLALLLLAQSSEEDEGAVSDARQIFRGRRCRRARQAAAEALWPMLLGPDATRMAAALWVRFCPSLSAALKRVGDLPKRSRSMALQSMLLYAGDKPKEFFFNSWFLRRIIKTWREELREDTSTWAAVGYAANSFNCHRMAFDWLADWEGRDGLTAWALFGLVLSAWHVKRYDVLPAVHRHASTLPRDKTSEILDTWWVAYVLCFESLDGQDSPSVPSFDVSVGYYHQLGNLLRAAIEAFRAHANGAPYELARQLIRRASKKGEGIGPSSGVPWRIYHRLQWRLASRYGRWFRAWCHRFYWIERLWRS